MEKRILEILSNKPEIITELPEWMLNEEDLDILRNEKNSALVEIAGRDSIAAAIMAVDERGLKVLLPSIVYTGTLYGNWKTSFRAVEVLKNNMTSRNVKVIDPVISGSPPFWWELCGKYNYEFQKKYGFYSPCLGCHLYFHAQRIPLARKLGLSVIVAGERESHDGKIKLSQIGPAIDASTSLCSKFGIDLALPLRMVTEGRRIRSILGNNWEEGQEQLKCVLTRNYLFADGSITFSEESIRSYFKDFALPSAEKQVSKWLENIS